MSISLKDFREGNFNKRFNKREEHPVLLFLREKKRAFTVKEMVKATRMNEFTVRGMLQVLEKKGIVEHDIPYYAIKEETPKKVKKKKKDNPKKKVKKKKSSKKKRSKK